MVSRDADRIEVVLDAVTVARRRPRRLPRSVEVEAEVVKGEGRPARRVGKQLRKAGARDGRTDQPKLPAVPRTLAAPRPGPPATSRSTACASCSSSPVRAMLANDPGVRLGRGSRGRCTSCQRRNEALTGPAAGGRGRSSPPTGRSRCGASWPGWAGCSARFAMLDVLLEHLDAEAERPRGRRRPRLPPAPGRLAAERNDGRAALLEAMGSARYFELLDRLEGVSAAPAGDDAQPLADIAAAEFASLRQAVKALPKQPTDDAAPRHSDPREARPLRRPSLPQPELGKRGARLVERAKEVQDVIGEHQDAFVAEERLRALALRGGGKTGLAAGRLIERQHDTEARRAEGVPRRVAQARQGRRGAFGCIPRGRRGRPTARRRDRRRPPAPNTTTGRSRRARPSRGESDEDCALREVEEETGLRCELLAGAHDGLRTTTRGPPEAGPLLADAPGRRRQSCGRRTRSTTPAGYPSDEAASVLSTSATSASSMVTGLSVTVLLVRHACAGDREEWVGDACSRPLDEKGRKQAKRLAKAPRASSALPGSSRAWPSAASQTFEPAVKSSGLDSRSADELAEGGEPRADVLSLLDDLGVVRRRRSPHTAT